MTTSRISAVISSGAVMKATRHDLRKFGWLMGGVLGAGSAAAYVWQAATLAPILLTAAAWLGAAGTVAPSALAPIYRAWMTLALALAGVNTRIILGLLFYACFTPGGLLMRWRGRDPLDRRARGIRDSHWKPRRPLRPARESYPRLY